MNLGIIGKPKEESFILAKEEGLEFLEFTINNDEQLEELENALSNVKEYMSTYNIKIGSIGRWGTTRLTSDGDIVEHELKQNLRLIEICKELGSPVFNCGCNVAEDLSFERNCQAAIKFFKKLIEHGEARGIKIATVNCPWNNFVTHEKAWNIIHKELETLGIKYDPSHCYYGGRDYLHEIKEWGHRFYHFHLKGALIIDGERCDDPPAGMGQIKWPEVMALLYKVKYDYGLSIEPHSTTWSGELGRKGISFTVNYINPYIL